MDLAAFKAEYERWVEESLPDYNAGRLTDIVKRYPFIVPDEIPWTTYRGEPSQQTFTVVTSGGLFLKHSQPPFETASIHGDPSVRFLPKTVRQDQIGFAHAHYDHSLAERDLNIILPVHRLVELEEEGVIGKLADTLYSFSYINNVVPLVEEEIPALISRLEADEVDAVLLVPV